jgi:hypothetical protein
MIRHKRANTEMQIEHKKEQSSNIIVGEKNLLNMDRLSPREKSIEILGKVGERKKGESGSYINKSELGLQGYENQVFMH